MSRNQQLIQRINIDQSTQSVRYGRQHISARCYLQIGKVINSFSIFICPLRLSLPSFIHFLFSPPEQILKILQQPIIINILSIPALGISSQMPPSQTVKHCPSDIIICCKLAKMNSQSNREHEKGLPSTEGQLRRSSRQRKQPKHDDYFMGALPLEDILDPAAYDEDCRPKRRRTHHRFDDSDDYSQGHKTTRKHKTVGDNKVEALLEWRTRTQMLPLIVDCTQEVPMEDLYRLKVSKNVAAENLLALGEDLQAIFVNIDWGKKGQTMREFKQLKLQSNRLMSRGLVFVWAPKESVSEMLAMMQEKGFQYVQNFQVINFDIEKAKARSSTFRKKNSTNSEQKKQESTQDEEVDLPSLIRSLDNVDPCELIASEPSCYFKASKRTLLMFRKNTAFRFQLRHQRTCDVVFDMPLRLGEKCECELKGYICKMIETLLPECLTLSKREGSWGLKMMELWGDRDYVRRGWVSVVQE